MEEYTTQGLIELGTDMLEDNQDCIRLYFLGDEIYELDNIDLDVVYSHFEEMGYDCYMESYAIQSETTFDYEPVKVLVITK